MTQLLQTAIEEALQLPADVQNDLALAMLTHIKKGKKKPRQLGLARGQGSVSDDFNDALPPEEEGLWYEGNPGDPLVGMSFRT